MRQFIEIMLPKFITAMIFAILGIAIYFLPPPFMATIFVGSAIAFLIGSLLCEMVKVGKKRRWFERCKWVYKMPT